MLEERSVHDNVTKGSKTSHAAHTTQPGSIVRKAAAKGEIPHKLVAKNHDKLSLKDANEEKARSAQA
jgi:hypothetical protein